MSVNVLITLGLCAVLALVLVKRKSLRDSGAPGADRSRSRGTGGTKTGEEPARKRRNRPKLGLTVTMTPAEAERAEGESPTATDETRLPAPIEVPQVPLIGPAEIGDLVEAPAQVVPVAVGVAAAVAELSTVDAPGWPSPGELAGMYALDEFDPVPTGGGEQSSTPDADPVEFDTSEWDEIEAVPGAVGEPEDSAELSDWETYEPAGASDDDPTEETAWGEPEWEADEAPQTTDEPVGAKWETGGWQWDATNQDPAADQQGQPPADEPVSWDLPEQMAMPEIEPEVDSARQPFTLAQVDEPTTSASPFTSSPDDLTLAASAVDLAREAGNNSPVVVVVHQAAPAVSARERELEARVAELEAQLAAIAAPAKSRPRTTTSTLVAKASQKAPRNAHKQAPRTHPRRTAQTGKRTAAKPNATPARLTLSAAEARRLRALVARRSLPTDVRNRARIILAAARGQRVATIADRVGVSQSTVRRWTTRFASERLRAIPQA